MTRQNYYARRRHRQRRAVDEELILGLVRGERQVQPRLGTRKLQVVLADALTAAGVTVGRDRFFEVLRGGQLLVASLPKEYPRTTNSYHYLPVFKNLIKARTVTQPNEVWVSDLTYLRTREGFLYLALLTDKYSRKIVGYHCGDRKRSAQVPGASPGDCGRGREGFGNARAVQNAFTQIAARQAERLTREPFRRH